MFETVAGFMKAMMTSLAWPWRFWVVALMLVNGVTPFFFLETSEAKGVLAAFMVAAGIQMAIFRSLGFVRLLGIGHIIAWVPLLIWLWGPVTTHGTSSAFGQWLLALFSLNAISLLIDLVDVGRYMSGERDAPASAQAVQPR